LSLRHAYKSIVDLSFLVFQPAGDVAAAALAAPSDGDSQETTIDTGPL
jgi:hypothetical protein